MKEIIYRNVENNGGKTIGYKCDNCGRIYQ